MKQEQKDEEELQHQHSKDFSITYHMIFFYLRFFHIFLFVEMNWRKTSCYFCLLHACCCCSFFDTVFFLRKNLRAGPSLPMVGPCFVAVFM